MAEFSIQIATKYNQYGHTPKVFSSLDWMGEALLDLSWIPACMAQVWMGEALLDLAWLPDVQEWAADEDNVLYMADHCRLPEVYYQYLEALVHVQYKTGSKKGSL